ncbi:hypothetical protein DFH28DRAFT_129374 [Melampsora americana]|nr:hypothetical protein DFH28DRAFT_129374 [Melampsora americana]
MTSPKDFTPIIHSDLSPKGANYLKKELKEYYYYPLTDSDEFRKAVEDEKRVVIFNVWRPVQIVKDNPLAICDWKSLKKTDALNSEITPTNLNNAIQPWNYKGHQKWVYVPNQKPEEVFVFIQHDSHGKGGHGINVPHASVVLKGQEDKPSTRQSYEFRIAVIMDNESLMEEEPATEAKPVKEEQSVKEKASSMEEEPPIEASDKQGFLHKLVSCFFP